MGFFKKISGQAWFLIAYQTFLAISLPFYFIFGSPTWGMAFVAVVLLYISGISITGEYHRYFSHRSYKTRPVIESILLFFGSLAVQGSAFRWSFEHRLHHAHVDTDKDPYSINKGFWYAHFLWLLDEPKKIDTKIVSDLAKNKRVMFQHKYAKSCMLGSNLLVLLFVGWFMNDYLGAFFLATGLRLLLLHHFTWFINSLAHTWGDKPFCQEQSAVDNFIISLLTFGEGYHNYHHTYANDYRNGIRWYHFDPTKWVIWTLNKLGLASNLKRMDPLTIKKRMVLERKQLVTERLKSVWYVKKEELEAKIQELSDRIVEKVSRFKKLKESYHELKVQNKGKELLKELSQEIRNLKKSIQADWRDWSRLSSGILKLKPLPVST